MRKDQAELIEEIMAARQKRAEALHDLILTAREAIRNELEPDSPAWMRTAFDALHAAHHTLGGDPFDMHMRAALARPETDQADRSVPVAWVRKWFTKFGPCVDEFTDSAELAEQWRGHPQTREVVPLYTAPVPAQADGAVPLSVQDPRNIIAGIKQFGLASDGSDIRDLEAAIARLAAPVPAQAVVTDALERLIAYAEDLERCVRILGGVVVDSHDDMAFARAALIPPHPHAGRG